MNQGWFTPVHPGVYAQLYKFFRSHHHPSTFQSVFFAVEKISPMNDSLKAICWDEILPQVSAGNTMKKKNNQDDSSWNPVQAVNHAVMPNLNIKHLTLCVCPSPSLPQKNNQKIANGHKDSGFVFCLMLNMYQQQVYQLCNTHQVRLLGPFILSPKIAKSPGPLSELKACQAAENLAPKKTGSKKW